MGRAFGKLTICFEEPFWVGIFERIEDGRLTVAKVTFGAEPKDYEINAFLQQHYRQLRFSPAVAATVKESAENPKRRQRDVKKQLKHTSIGTKSQQALKLQQEQLKTERKEKSREQKEADKQFRFHLKQQKKKDRHRGR